MKLKSKNFELIDFIEFFYFFSNFNIGIEDIVVCLFVEVNFWFNIFVDEFRMFCLWLLFLDSRFCIEDIGLRVINE